MTTREAHANAKLWSFGSNAVRLMSAAVVKRFWHAVDAPFCSILFSWRRSRSQLSGEHPTRSVANHALGDAWCDFALAAGCESASQDATFPGSADATGRASYGTGVAGRCAYVHVGRLFSCYSRKRHSNLDYGTNRVTLWQPNTCW